jgi:predicted nucleic acid-binding protein
MDKPRVYVESSVVSYYVARPSRDVIVLAHQEITRDWWDHCLAKFDPYISEFVLEEIQRGDAQAAERRLAVVSEWSLLPVVPSVEHLVTVYATELHLPEASYRDALHIAMASVHGVDYLVTWNCRHIANAYVRRRLADINVLEGVSVPIICTPEELLDDRAPSIPEF